MFRGTNANPFDDVVAKATDENLTSENWEFIMEAVDKVEGGGSDAPREVVGALIKRLAHRNAQVQIYTLETANALSQNCGLKVHQELSSRAFTDALLRLASDRNTHQTVKSKILERMEDWAEMFSKDPNLFVMEQAYTKLKSQNPSIPAPSKPTKNAITDADRLKEEEDLARALEISLQDTRRQQNFPAASASSNSNATQKQPEPKPEQPPANSTAATVSRVRALYDFVPTESGELAFRKGDIIAVLESVYKDWWKGSLRGQTGIFPLNYVEKLADPTAEELQREAQTEAEVFAQIKNVEKLLSLLSTSSADQHIQDNDEITALYHQTLSIRPKLIDLISKYQQKRDDFQALNEKFVKARRDYEALLDTSMSNPAAHAYSRPPYSQGYGPGPEYGAPLPGPAGGPIGGPLGGPIGGPVGGPPGGPQGFYPPQPQHQMHHSPPPPLNTSGPYGPPDAQQGGVPYPVSTSPIPPAGSNPSNFYGAPTGPIGGPDGRKASSPQANPPTGRDRHPSISGYHDTGAPPQELATSSYESPQDPSGRPISPSHGPQQAYKSYYTYNPPTTAATSQGAGPSGPSGNFPPSGGQQQQPQQQQQPSYPPVITRTSPTTVRDSTDTYQQYLNNRPPSWVDPSTGGQGNPADYYRNNELFLPQGGSGGARPREA
ncbi:ESCRT-0 subunit protein hse1, variant 2 [Orbilia oligospora]|uniref:Class E vacuolar protein-sorting machinery protein HSE1 n=1 Tax=Orbilia oligospora TaxID=2813651 RepID=A0A6G1MKX3_ORBOL|nr:ESCRT-0 subunit protein hse1, variant 2 [Orbilia oligospora]KAF3261814.1 ESCRT-0 subunit protein hse1, variant 2 [Orbilia oligospora]